MKDQKRTNMERSPGADPTVTKLLRAAYTPPTDDAFWAGLEQRIRSRLHEQPVVSTWWSVLSEWRTAGLIAATLALVISGATIMREKTMEAQTRQIAAEAALRSYGGEVVPVVISVKSRDSVPDYQPERYLNPFEP